MTKRLSGMPGFSVVWFGQVVSLLGSGMTQFGLTIWAWQITGRATALALVGFFAFAPLIVMTPLAGALVDRWNRKLLMIASDSAAALATAAILILLRTNQLQIWHLYAAAAFAGTFGAFQFPAYAASISLMVHKRHYTRANAMLGLADSISGIFAPIAAGALLAFVGLGRILWIDLGTFLFAIASLLVVPIPQPEPSADPARAKRSVWADAAFGFRYIFARRSLTALLGLIFAINLMLTFSAGVLAPMILARTGDNQLVLGTVQMLFGVGGLVGGALVSLWGGPKRRIDAALLAVLFTGIFGNALLGIGRSVYIWGAGAFLAVLFIPLANGASSSIWQSKVPPDLQGRVFSARLVLGQIGRAVALPLSGVLADRVFEPLMLGSSGLARALAPLVGTGPGAGMGLMFVLFGALCVAVTTAGYLYRPIREVETLVPDWDPG